MATKEDIARSIATYIRRCGMDINIVEGVQSKIDNLIYTDSGMSLSENDKVDIINEIELDLRSPRVGDLRYLCESDDSQAFIDLMKAIKVKAKGEENVC